MKYPRACIRLVYVQVQKDVNIPEVNKSIPVGLQLEYCDRCELANWTEPNDLTYIPCLDHGGLLVLNWKPVEILVEG